MLPTLPERSVRTVLDPREACIPFAAAWAVEIAAGETPQFPDMAAFSEQATHPDAGCCLHIWYGAPADEDISPLLSYLPSGEQQEIARLQVPAHRWGVAAARAAVRAHLAVVLGCLPRDVAIIRDSLGKPALDPAVHGPAAERLHFNVSHTSGLVAVAMATRRVGVDVEAVRPLTDRDGIAASVFAPEMLQVFRDAPEGAAKTALFYRFWVLGEALIKATGQGFAQDTRSFVFPPSGAPRLTRIDGLWGPAARWTFGVVDATASR